MEQTPHLQPSGASAANAFAFGTNVAKMRNLVARLEDLLERHLGKRLRAAPEHAWSRFAGIPEATQNAIMGALESQAEFLEGAILAGVDGLDERLMLRYAMNRLSLLADQGTMDSVAPEDVIEIFDSEGRQIYRSYNCFTLSNYSLLELTTYPWMELYERSHQIEAFLVEACHVLSTGAATYVSLHDRIPNYTLRELLTEQRAVFAVREKFGARMISAVSGSGYVLSSKTIVEVASSSAPSSIRYL